MSGNNGNGNGHREYERADTPPSGNEFSELLALARGVKDTEIALGIVADDVSMLKAGVHRVHVSMQAERAENEARHIDTSAQLGGLTEAVFGLTASVNDALVLARQAMAKASEAERASQSNEAVMDLAAKSVNLAATTVERKRDSMRAREAKWTEAFQWAAPVRKYVWIPFVMAAGAALLEAGKMLLQ